ncbi:MAG: transglutaminase-like domain-containing protein [Methanobacteriaceae archaeon]|nr:transglutaminase-like domain-containing protein [Methanobacteriaceae archaeon]
MRGETIFNNKTLLLTIFIVLFLAIGSVCAADSDVSVSDVNSEILNSDNLNFDGNNINDGSNALSSIAVEDAKSVNVVSAENNDTITNNLSATNKVTVAQVITASSTVKTYVEKNKLLPDTVTVGSYSVSIAQFSYLASEAVKALNAKKATSTTIDIISVTKGSVDYTFKKDVYKADYVSWANSLSSYIVTNKTAPNYLSLGSDKCDFKTYTFGFAKILVWYNNNGKVLPNYCTYDSSVFKKVVNQVTVAQVITASATVKTYVEKNKALPNTVTVGSYSVSIAQFSYLASEAVKALNAKKATSTTIDIISVTKGSVDYTFKKDVYKADYVSWANSLSSYIVTNKAAPNYLSLGSAKCDFKTYTFGFAKILVWYNDNGKVLPNYCTFDSSVFKDQPAPVPSVQVTVAQVISASATVKTYVEKNGVLPNTVTIGNNSVSIAQFAYLASESIKLLNAKKATSTLINVTTVTGSSFTCSVNKTASLAAYLTMANTVSSSCSSKNVAPDYVTAGSSKIDYRLYTYGFAKILVWYKNNGVLPNTCSFDSSVFKNTPSPTTKQVTVAQVISASATVKTYVENNGVLPNTVTVGGNSVSIAQFAYLASESIKLLNAKKSTSTKIDIIDVTNKSANYTINKNLSLASCLSLANSVSSNCNSQHVAPAYVVVSSTYVDFKDYTYGFAKILVWYTNNKNTLPAKCLFDSSVFTVINYVTVLDVINSAASVKNSVDEAYVLPSTVTVGKYKLSIAQFSYLAAEAIKLLNAKKSTSTKIKVIGLTNGDVTYTFSKTLSLSAYVSWANSLSNYILEKGVAPNYLSSGSDKCDFRTYTFGFAKILVWYKGHSNTLPNTCAFDSSVFSSIKYKKGINEVNTESDISKYLVASGNCALNDAIKKLAADLTKNCKTDLEKATAIYNYVRDEIDYDFYYNTQYKATGTLKYKKGNCCDETNLIVALCRASGIAARYCHSTACTFNSGTYGHVWAQILVDGVWYCADATSMRNSLGVIKNWNSMSTLNQYASLPF